MELSVISVKQLNMYVKTLLEGDSRLATISVKGEISNFKNHYSSGHLYFTLKDSDAAIRCVMFRFNAASLRFTPCDGMQVVLTGKASIYEKDGQYQFYVEQMHDTGIGDIALQFEQIKKRLSDEGLFDLSHKRPLPKYPSNIAVVTSQTGAAIRDILNVLSRRYPLAKIIMCPVSVQGEAAVPEMLDALDRIYALSVADLIIIGRGGGSIEDLWAFNSELLARKIYESPVPVISAVGHETDFTICDFVADMRAPTPSAAAEIAVPDSSELYAYVDKLRENLIIFLRNKYSDCVYAYEKLSTNRIFAKPKETLLFERHLQLDKLSDALKNAANRTINEQNNRFSLLAAKLDSLSPLKIMSRGYSVVSGNKGVITKANQTQVGEDINITLAEGSLECRVLDRMIDNE